MSESQSSILLMEMTKNPFESDIEDRLNFPGFSPSMFTTPRTPVNRKVFTTINTVDIENYSLI
jgi:hypothetical protein